MLLLGIQLIFIDDAENLLQSFGKGGYRKLPNWRVHFGFKLEESPLPVLREETDFYTIVSAKLQSTRVAGRGFIELIEISGRFQRKRHCEVSIRCPSIQI